MSLCLSPLNAALWNKMNMQLHPYLLKTVWMDKPKYDEAERLYHEECATSAALERGEKTSVSLAIVPLTAGPTPAAMQTPDDEGYLTATPTPATPGLSLLDHSNHTVPVLPAPFTQSINGKPQVPGCLRQLVSGVWLEKPIYDQAEKSYYERLCDGFSPAASLQKGRKNRRNKKASKEAGACNRTSGSESNNGFDFSATVADSNGSVSQGTMEEEDDGRLVLKAKEAESNVISVPLSVQGHLSKASVRFFLHQDSERVWLNKPLFDTAEKRYYEAVSDQASRSSARPTVGASMPGLAAPAPRQQAK
ncbi:UNVERIFIED_CONTAM: hypothetical protein FKN15_002969 [Acipenser sinensis]